MNATRNRILQGLCLFLIILILYLLELTAYLCMEAVFPASCLSLRMCLRSPFETLFIFFVLAFLSAIGATPLAIIAGSPWRGLPDMQLDHLAEMEAHDRQGDG